MKLIKYKLVVYFTSFNDNGNTSEEFICKSYRLAKKKYNKIVKLTHKLPHINLNGYEVDYGTITPIIEKETMRGEL